MAAVLTGFALKLLLMLKYHMLKWIATIACIRGKIQNVRFGGDRTCRERHLIQAMGFISQKRETDGPGPLPHGGFDLVRKTAVKGVRHWACIHVTCRGQGRDEKRQKRLVVRMLCAGHSSRHRVRGIQHSKRFWDGVWALASGGCTVTSALPSLTHNSSRKGIIITLDFQAGRNHNSNFPLTCFFSSILFQFHNRPGNQVPHWGSVQQSS